MKILIIEDETELMATAKSYLVAEGYVCEEAATFSEGMEKIANYEYDCVVADLGLPDGSGLELINQLKGKTPETGVIIISAKNALGDKIAGLDLGADDYLTKPFHLSELNARIKSILRRRKFRGSREITFNEIKVFPETLQTFVNYQPVALTKKEFDLLVYFISNQNRMLTKESIAEHLWGDYIDNSDSFDFVYTHLSNLRRKLMELGARDYIRTVYRVGYKFTGDETA